MSRLKVMALVWLAAWVVTFIIALVVLEVQP